MKLGIPISTLLLIITFFILKKVFLNKIPQNLKINQNDILFEKNKLGKIDTHSVFGICIFCFTAFFWIFRVPFNDFFHTDISDPQISITGGLMLFLIQPKGIPLLEWKDTKKLPWDILLLFGVIVNKLEFQSIMSVILTSLIARAARNEFP